MSEEGEGESEGEKSRVSKRSREAMHQVLSSLCRMIWNLRKSEGKQLRICWLDRSGWRGK